MQPVQIKPDPVILEFNRREMKCFSVLVQGEEYQQCVNASENENYWANSKPGEYGAGMGREADDKYKPVRTGMLGEMAFSKVFGTDIDFSYQVCGDAYDAVLGGKTLDIKCTMKNNNKILIYKTNEWGKPVSLKKDLYIGCYVSEEDREHNWAEIIIVGWLPLKAITECPVMPGYGANGRTAKHYNYEVYFRMMEPIGDLYEAAVAVSVV